MCEHSPVYRQVTEQISKSLLYITVDKQIQKQILSRLCPQKRFKVYNIILHVAFYFPTWTFNFSSLWSTLITFIRKCMLVAAAADGTWLTPPFEDGVCHYAELSSLSSCHAHGVSQVLLLSGRCMSKWWRHRHLNMRVYSGFGVAEASVTNGVGSF